jgi:hypothetical protein
VAISEDDTSRSGMANVTISAGANILALHPASVNAGAAEGFTLRVEGSGFAAASPGPGSTLVIGGMPRATTCSTSFECTAQVSAEDVAQPGNLTVQAVNGGSSSNGVFLVVAATNGSDEVIALTTGNPSAAEKDIVVVDPTTAGVSEPGDDLDLNVAALGVFSATNNTCALTGNPVPGATSGEWNRDCSGVPVLRERAGHRHGLRHFRAGRRQRDCQTAGGAGNRSSNAGDSFDGHARGSLAFYTKRKFG